MYIYIHKTHVTRYSMNPRMWSTCEEATWEIVPDVPGFHVRNPKPDAFRWLKILTDKSSTDSPTGILHIHHVVIYIYSHWYGLGQSYCVLTLQLQHTKGFPCEAVSKVHPEDLRLLPWNVTPKPKIRGKTIHLQYTYSKYLQIATGKINTVIRSRHRPNSLGKLPLRPPSYWKLNWQWEGTLSPWQKAMICDVY